MYTQSVNEIWSCPVVFYFFFNFKIATRDDGKY